MKRKEFLNMSSKAFLGLVITNSLLLSCTSDNLNLKDIIGKNKNILNTLNIEYDGEISCYSTDKFNHQVNGQKLFIFCIKNKIVGFSIKTNDKFIGEKIISQVKEKHLIFDNAFGMKENWKKKNIFKSLCIPKDYKKIDKYIFYSEYLEEASSIIW